MPSCQAVSVVTQAVSMVVHTVSVVAHTVSVVAHTVSVVAHTVSVVAHTVSVVAHAVSGGILIVNLGVGVWDNDTAGLKMFCCAHGYRTGLSLCPHKGPA